MTLRQGCRIGTTAIYRSAQETRTSWVAFLLVTFLSAKQRKVTRQRAKSFLDKGAKIKTRDILTKLQPLADRIAHYIFNLNLRFLSVGYINALNYNPQLCHVAVRSSPATYGVAMPALD